MPDPNGTLIQNYNRGDTDIDIIWFSRGAALALDFANKIAREGILNSRAIRSRCLHHKPSIRFLGLFDVVASFGVGGNNINAGKELSLPAIVENAAHAVARDEQRPLFPLTRVPRAIERAFPGDHSDIGSGHGEDTRILSRSPLLFIANKGRKAGVPFGAIKERSYIMDWNPHDLSQELVWKISNNISYVFRWGSANHRVPRNNLPQFHTVSDILADP